MKYFNKSGLLVLLFLIASIQINLFAQATSIIPRPNEIIKGTDTFLLNDNLTINFAKASEKSALYLKNYLLNSLNMQEVHLKTSEDNKGHIKFILNNNLLEEAYILEINKNNIVIKASNNTGWFYGIQSLIQLIEFEKYNSIKSESITLNEVVIKDEPRFKWRAFMLDEARYFKGMEQVKLLLDEMAFLKMNVFHWHLVDDQGWRIEIKKYPLLTSVGSKRKSTQVGSWGSSIQSGEEHKGYYSQNQIKEIVQYAEDRHITIVPEIEMPGHSSAAIAAYNWLGTSKKNIDVPINFGVGKDVYDVSDPKVFQFLTDVLDEVIQLFPSKVIHIGGDEVKYNHWKNSESVQKYMKDNGIKSPAELQITFTNKISQYLKNRNRKMMGWNEILGHNLHKYQDEKDVKSATELAEGTVIHFWKGNIELASSAASKGYEIVNSLNTHTYLDYSYESIPLSKAYNFDPIPKGLALSYHKNIIGLGCQMWGEWIPTIGEMHFKVFPRIAAFAEVGWTKASNKDFTNFTQSLKTLQKRWEQKGIYYAPDSAFKKK